YRLLWVVVAANAIAIVLQVAVSLVTAATGSNLATLIAQRWPRLSPAFWAIFQGAAMATDVAEFSGIVLGVELLFHLSLLASVAIGLIIIAAVLACTDRRSKALEYGLIGAVALISIGCLYQIPLLHPIWSAVALGAITPRVPDAGALVLVIGIIGATVMPHNLFLHSSLIEKNYENCDPLERRRRHSFFTKETFVALNVAALINGGILIVGAALHGADGSMQHAFASLLPLGGGAAVIFGGALLISGVAASTTATVSGDYIFAAFSPVKISSAVRRAVTIVPAAIVIASGISITNLLVWSQVALAFVLPVVLVPLVLIMLSMRGKGLAAIGYRLTGLVAGVSFLCAGFDAVMIVQILHP
ncbi:MAG: Nramp family divalent metal transporter, partial [Candidatus Eremiobacteraeota bacterium]|nr:Nramp family divalent metal transporter [Candidatus Eremiobacteraeota bacterium]